jgi:hypothetical protein
VFATAVLGAIWGAHDRDADVVYLYSEHYRGQAEPSIHAEGIKARGDWMQGVIDPASRGRGQRDGEQLLQNYVDLGLLLTKAENGVEAGLFDVWQRLSTGRLKVFRTCQNWLAEFHLYRRDDKGAVVKKDDHLMDATRYYIVSGIPLCSVAPDAGHILMRSPTGASAYLRWNGAQSNHQSDYDHMADLD